MVAIFRGGLARSFFIPYESAMSTPRPTPYDGSSKLFQIGLKPLDLSDWIDVDERLPDYLGEKERLAAAHPDETFVAEAGTQTAQAEVLALLAAHLPGRFPETYRRIGNAIEIAPTGRRVALDVPGMPPLKVAAALVQEDLVLMRKSDSGWRLAAGSLSFPSSWRLREKFGHPIHEVHGPVPGFGAGTRNAELIARMFDNLRPEIAVIRWNWSIYGDDELYHPEAASPETRRFGENTDRVFLRVERQTLRKLPQSRDILFTIRIHVDPLAALEAEPEAPRIAGALVAQLGELNDEQVAYKGLTLERERLMARLGRIAART
jgi:hypothetical protein